jgi:hypothetical protein
MEILRRAMAIRRKPERNVCFRLGPLGSVDPLYVNDHVSLSYKPFRLVSMRTDDEPGEIYGTYALLIFGGAMIVAFNATLLGSNSSVLMFSSILGYSCLPFVIAAA